MHLNLRQQHTCHPTKDVPTQAAESDLAKGCRMLLRASIEWHIRYKTFRVLEAVTFSNMRHRDLANIQRPV
jgi:hypothetical protein